MASAEFSFDLGELDGLAKVLEKAKLSSPERRQLLVNIGVEAEAQTQERFDTQLNPEGKKWQDLAEKTKQYYARYFPGQRRTILAGSGGLRDSIESQVDDWSVLVGATKVYAATHQYGRGKIPARPYLGISTSNAEDIMRVVNLFLAERIA
jgi:phage virion morphogenesis protein